MQINKGFHLFSSWWYDVSKGIALATFTGEVESNYRSLFSVSNSDDLIRVDILWVFTFVFDNE